MSTKQTQITQPQLSNSQKLVDVVLGNWDTAISAEKISHLKRQHNFYVTQQILSGNENRPMKSPNFIVRLTSATTWCVIQWHEKLTVNQRVTVMTAHTTTTWQLRHSVDRWKNWVFDGLQVADNKQCQCIVCETWTAAGHMAQFGPATYGIQQTTNSDVKRCQELKQFRVTLCEPSLHNTHHYICKQQQ